MINKLNKYLSWDIEYNPHKTAYEPITNFLLHTEDDYLEREKCIEEDEMYWIIIYPRTPVASYSVYCYDLEKGIDYLINEIERNVKE